MKKKLLLGPLFCVFLLTSGCLSKTSLADWPTNLPPRSVFVETFQQQATAGTNSNSLQNHLFWVKRYYQGSIIYPLGWNRMTEMLLATLSDESQKSQIRSRMNSLGMTIVIEWAQDNKYRAIDSSTVAVWGNALRTASQLGEQQRFIAKVEQDVEALIAGELHKKRITRERYYPPEDFDDF
jgi:hypothetical protein